MRVEREGLEHQGDVAVGRLQVLHRLAVDQDVALVDRLQAGDGAQRRRLAAARLAEQHDELVVLDLQVQVLDDLDGAEIFLDAAKLDLGHDCWPSWWSETSKTPSLSSFVPSGLPNQPVNMKVDQPDDDDGQAVAVEEEVPGLAERDDAERSSRSRPCAR